MKLMPAEYVRPFVKSSKNDYVDAEAIAEAVHRPTMRFVPVKNEAQLDLQAVLSTLGSLDGSDNGHQPAPKSSG